MIWMILICKRYPGTKGILRGETVGETFISMIQLLIEPGFGLRAF